MGGEVTERVRTIVVTGGCGFVGSALIRKLIRRTGHIVINVDSLTYAASAEAVEECSGSPRYHFVKTDIANEGHVRDVFRSFNPDGVINLAAESHVDRSIDEPAGFMHTNVMGTYVLLDVARWYLSLRSKDQKARFRFHHVSTDEVYGSLSNDHETFSEETAYRPRSPYAASKAAADHLVQAWYETYDLPVVLTNCSNNYGPWQFPEKLIPLTIIRALKEEPLLIYGSGRHTRDWLFVDDHADAILVAFLQGRNGEKYNVGGGAQFRNVEVVERVCSALDEIRPLGNQRSYRSLIRFVPDRPGHDYRYAMNCRKITEELGWRPTNSFEAGLRTTIEWYVQNEAWWRSILQFKYDGRRLGLTVSA